MEGGTGFYDKSALNHIHGEYQFNPVLAKKNGFKVDYYIPPKTWAWNPGRTIFLKKYVDNIYSGAHERQKKLSKKYPIALDKAVTIVYNTGITQ